MSKTAKTPKGTVLPLMNLKGKDYLQVAYRIVWFREEEPQSGVETSFLTLTEGYAVAQAKIIRDGRVVAMATKREDKQSFADFIEKAETGAIGRALALLGYGTQFTLPDLDEGEHLADSPVETKKTAKISKEDVTPTTTVKGTEVNSVNPTVPDAPIVFADQPGAANPFKKPGFKKPGAPATTTVALTNGSAQPTPNGATKGGW